MTGLVLPGPLAAAEPGAGTEYGKRIVTWTTLEPGSWHRCLYSIAWITVTEREPWKGEPLWLSAQRRPQGAGSWSRTVFTDKARAAIAAEVLPLVARYGFDRLWTELHRAKNFKHLPDRVRRAEREAEWWRLLADLAEMHTAGFVEFRPVAHDIGSRELSVEVVPEFHGQARWEPVAASAWVNGEQVGWMTPKASLIPMADVLRETPATV